MTEAEFWHLVTRNRLTQSDTELMAQLTERLTPLTPAQLAEFDKHFAKQMRRSYLWTVWGAAYVLTGIDSDYGFAEFRSYLISLGQEWFEKVLANPDDLAQLPEFVLKDGYPYPFLEEYDLVAGQLYEDRCGHELPFVPSGKNAPAGKKFDDRPKMLKKAYPQLCTRFPF
ncbi:hypothetical protein NFHSH190041_06420 [Shewanella sp. NFH-SH190041]|uniref:DUF4240 domain-containing protein n=1 Tax=Shewanella sp. NFH-SH190041 TaxID=2950245 RepID=UPI0021C28B14|nr:DUF4240 domain-containing protein [Shewanella sp. NFH-SH190041]BDM63190.1 hypothetical protein NFHSH190041_06420 [Shewanella sp. NFH-SH190041]